MTGKLPYMCILKLSLLIFKRGALAITFLFLKVFFFLETINRKINKQIGKDINTVIGIYFIYNLNQKKPPQFAPEIISFLYIYISGSLVDDLRDGFRCFTHLSAFYKKNLVVNPPIRLKIVTFFS